MNNIALFDAVVAASKKLDEARLKREAAQDKLYIAQGNFRDKGTEELCTAQGSASIDLINAFDDERQAEAALEDLKKGGY